MTWYQEERVCNNCNYKLLEPKRLFHEDFGNTYSRRIHGI